MSSPAVGDSEKLISPAYRIYVAGHRGMAGSAICRALVSKGYGEAGGGALLTARQRNQIYSPRIDRLTN